MIAKAMEQATTSLTSHEIDWRDHMTLVNEQGRELDAATIGKGNWKLLSSLGHVWLRFLDAQRVLLKRGYQDITALEPWLQSAPKVANLLLPSEFEMVVTTTSQGLHWKGIAGVSWEGANAPIWPALLRLPALQSFWEQQLRASVHETLLKVMPHAWLMEQASVPPGAVIAGLGISSWQELDLPAKRKPSQDNLSEREVFIVTEDQKFLRQVECTEGWWVLAKYRADEKGTYLQGAKGWHTESRLNHS